MKQIIQSFKTGETLLEDVPSPKASEGQVIIKTTRSLVSLGTERMLVEFGKANLVQKARQQPDKVKMVLDKIKSDGLLPTLETVFNKLGQPLPLGYCNAGRIIEVGKNVKDFKVGDRVASNGPHAEFVSVPQNLVAHIPDNVSDDEATFTVIGSIGLQSIRLLQPTMGETIVVSGLGLIGLITAQLLRASGCNVIGLDPDESKLAIARSLDIEAYNPISIDPVLTVSKATNNIGADGVIITASSKSDLIISQSAQMSRKRGRIVLVGVIGLSLNRSEFYEKELTFQVSCSYGPGRYDDDYEQKGHDYPLPFVRWTEKRNFETLLASISNNSIDVKKLITEIVDFYDFDSIYGNIGHSKSVASILKYNDQVTPDYIVSTNKPITPGGKIAIVGAGNFTKMTMLPSMDCSSIKYIISKGGLSAKSLAVKHKIPFASSDFEEVLNDNDISLAVITTRHNLHAAMTLMALKAGKNVFVEKPLALSTMELNEIILAKEHHDKSVIVGFNRRFSPHIQKIKNCLPASSSKNIVATMNAGYIPSDVWVHDMNVGGGRIVGEACHYFDLLVHLTGSKIVSVCMTALGKNPKENTDNASIFLRFENGDNGVINYFSNGNKAHSKEMIKIYFDQKTIVMDNFRLTTGYGVSSISKFKTQLDKGHKNQFTLLNEMVIKGGAPIIPFEEIVNVSKASLAAVQSLKENRWVDV